MVSKLETLKKKKATLLKDAGMKSANLESLKARRAEEKKLKAEIFALEHPESVRARDNIKSAAGVFGRFVKRNALLVARNAERIQKAKNEATKKERIEEKKLEKERLKIIKRRSSGKKVSKKIQKRKTKSVDYGW